jgi:hypothetical protein
MVYSVPEEESMMAAEEDFDELSNQNENDNDNEN